MTSPRERIINRRSIMLGAPLLAAGLWTQRPKVSAQVQVTGDCSIEPAVQYVRDYASQNLMALPAEKMGATLDPAVDWVMAQSGELGVLLIPPGWTLVNAWANTTDSDGMPEWQTTQLQFPFWATTLIVSPDESAMFMHVYGAYDNVELSAADGAELARQLVMGRDQRPDGICQVEQIDPPAMLQSSKWLTGDRYGSSLMVSKGELLISSVSGMTLGYGTTFIFDAFVAPATEAEDLVLNVYLKLLFQLAPKGGGGGDTTPTPSPTP